jgi:hypothetical protein
MKPLTVVAAVWMIIVGGLMIIILDGHIIIECIKCGVLFTRLLGVVSIGLGVATLVSGRRAG